MEDLKKSFLVRGNNIVGSGGSGEENTIESISVNGVDIAPDENKNVDITVPSIDGLTKDADLATVAKSGNYEDLDNKPEIPSVEGLAKTTDIPTKVSELENDSKYQTESDVTTTLTDYATKTYVGEQIANAEHLKREIVTVLPSDEEASDNIIYMLKVENATGNDKYQEYMKIDGTVQMVGDTSVDLTDYAKTAEIPTTVAELTDSADYAKSADIPTSLPADGGDADTVNNHTVESNVPADAVFTDTTYESVTQTEDGLMSAADKAKLDRVEEGATKTLIDIGLSSTSMNPVQNKVVTDALNNKADKSKYSDTTINVGRKASTTVGGYSTAEGYKTTASGESSHAEGLEATASGDFSHAEGENTTSTGESSHTEGVSTNAVGKGCHAEGNSTVANYENSHAEGNSSHATGFASHAENNTTRAKGGSSHAEGYQTTAMSDISHAEGESTNLAENYVTGDTSNEDIINSWNTNKFSLAKGKTSHVEGLNCLALGDFSHAEGDVTIAKGIESHAEGWSTEATGGCSHAEGNNTKATSDGSHAEGRDSMACAEYAHAEGDSTVADAYCSHAEGTCTTATGDYSHAEGFHTVAGYTYQHAQGKYNDNKKENLLEVGNGTSDTARSNALELTEEGKLTVSDDIVNGNGVSLDSIDAMITNNACRNLLEQNYPHAQVSTIKGVTFTINDDKSITIDGTATEQIDYYIYGAWASTDVIVKATKPLKINTENIVSGMNLIAVNNTSIVNTSSGDITTDVTCVILRISSGATFDNVTIYPMIYYADVSDTSYEPYYPTIKRLIKNINKQYIKHNPIFSEGDYFAIVRHYDYGYKFAIGCFVITSSGNFVNQCYYLGTTDKIELTYTDGVLGIENADNYDYIMTVKLW